MVARSFLISTLARQYLLLAEDFAQRYPHSWLAWESGQGSEPAAADLGATTVRPTAQPKDRPQASDALCFELAPTGTDDEFPIGRGPENRVVINEPTVSRNHVVVRWNRERGWSIEAAQDARPSLYQGRVLGASVPERLASGSRVIAGNVVLHFYEPSGFLDRVRRESRLIKA
jgi:hypothetical protein